MLSFEGDRELMRPPVEVWPRLSDARFLVECVPDVESVSQVEVDRAVCTIRPGLSFVRGSLQLTVQVAEAVPQNSVRLLLHTKGIGSSSDVEAFLALAPHNSSTVVHWIAQIQNIGGLLKAVPQGLIKAAAQKVIADVWASVEKKIIG